MNIPQYQICIGNQTDVGKVRSLNEDYMAHFVTSLGYCIIICDGMGGHSAGEIASQNAIEAIKHFLQNGKVTRLDTAFSIQTAIEFSNYKLREMVLKNPLLNGMGTTCVLALINHSNLYLAHAGDSRIYLIRKKKIIQLTKDHSTVQNLIDAGILTEAEAAISDKKNQITKAIGIFDKVDATIRKSPVPLLPNDKILLCSDGLTTHLNKKQILQIISGNAEVQPAAKALVDAANNAGGIDNITVQLIQYTGKFSKISIKRTKKSLIVALSILIIISFLSWFYLLNGKEKVNNFYTKFIISNRKSAPPDITKPQLHKKENVIDSTLKK